MSSQKVIIIGIDGATFDVIQPMLARRELPVLASLMEKGAWGELQSTVPPDTAPAWVSMMTGVNPGKHGVFFFLDNLHNNCRNGRALTASDINSPPLWSILSQFGKKVQFVNVPFTYPPMEVNGVVVSGMFIPASADVISYPENVYPDLARRLDGYEIDDWSRDALDAKRSNPTSHHNDILKRIHLVTEKRKQAVLILMEENPWDFLMVVFTSIDRLQHLFWSHMRTDTDDSERQNETSQAIFDGYRQIDQAIGEIIEKAGEDATVILTSDHGFGPLRKHFYVNKWLEEIGLLQVKKGVSRKKIVLAKPSIHRIVSRLFPFLNLPAWTKNISVPILRTALRERDEFINWNATKAYGNQSGINLNMQGREPYGIIERGTEAEEVLKIIEEKFSTLIDESGNKIGDWIKRKEDIFNGPYVDNAADLYFSIHNRSYLQNSRVDVDGMFGKSQLGSGMHRFNAIFIISGPLGRKNGNVKPDMVDIAPTVLYLMGLPVLEDMDGRVLEEAINPEYLRSHPVERICFEKGKGSLISFSESDEDKIKESLKGLGYLS